MSIRRSGATVILTYYAKEARLLLVSRAETRSSKVSAAKWHVKQAARWLQEDA